MQPVAPGIQLVTSPRGDAKGAFLKLLRSAKQSIHLADYSFNITAVASTLISKHRAGLDVKLVFDWSQARTKYEHDIIRALMAANVPMTLVESDKGAIMHNKFTVI